MSTEQYQKRKHPLEQQSIRDAVALNDAVNFYSGDDALGVLGVAEVFRDWLNIVGNNETVGFNNETVSQDKSETSTKASVSCPTPTLEQKKVLDEIMKRTGKPASEVYPRVLEWAKDVHNASQYPQNMTSITSYLEWSGWS